MSALKTTWQDRKIKYFVAVACSLITVCFIAYCLSQIPKFYRQLKANEIVQLGHTLGELAESNSGNLPRNWPEYLNSSKHVAKSLSELENSFIIESPGTPNQYVRIIDPALRDQQEILNTILKKYISNYVLK